MEAIWHPLGWQQPGVALLLAKTSKHPVIDVAHLRNQSEGACRKERELLILAKSRWLGAFLAIGALAMVTYFGWQALPWNGAATGDTKSTSESVSPVRPPLPQVGLPGAVAPGEELLPLPRQTAQEINAARPFSTLAHSSPRPFRSALSGLQLERAASCLAIAAIYEAGGSADDQSPVMQVILNRVRHPAFPKSVCGVVFEGSERQTGCQFSFTCDGSMLRWRPSAQTYSAAKERANAMLDGNIDRRVGLATHYHTDWVVPYWSASLVKITAVRTHLFFRWGGFWGNPAAFASQASAQEPAVPVLAAWSSAHIAKGELGSEVINAALGQTSVNDTPGTDTPQLGGSTASQFPPPSAPLQLTLRGPTPGRWALDALELCGSRPECRVVGWVDQAQAPRALGADAIVVTPPDFVFVQVLRNRVRQPYWDCKRWSQAATSRCLGSPSETASIVFDSKT